MKETFNRFIHFQFLYINDKQKLRIFNQNLETRSLIKAEGYFQFNWLLVFVTICIQLVQSTTKSVQKSILTEFALKTRLSRLEEDLNRETPVALSPCKEEITQQYYAENCYNNSLMRFLSSGRPLGSVPSVNW